MSRSRVLVAGPDRLDDYLRPYVRAVEFGGGEGVRAWPEENHREPIADLLASFDALLLPGGLDVDPARYGEAPHPKLGDTDPELDEGQIALARAALAIGLPTLAICRGIQVLGVAVGCTLYQDLPSQRPSSVVHRRPKPKDALVHEVEIDPPSRLAAIVGAGRQPVNSRHHQAVRGDAGVAVGPLRVVGHAPDGVVEAVEHPDLPFFIGVQWHPENLVATRPEALALFRAFVAAGGHATCRAGN